MSSFVSDFNGNWGYEYTEIVVEKYEITDEQGNKIDEISGHFFIKTSNIVKTQKDMTSLRSILLSLSLNPS